MKTQKKEKFDLLWSFGNGVGMFESRKTGKVREMEIKIPKVGCNESRQISFNELSHYFGRESAKAIIAGTY